MRRQNPAGENKLIKIPGLLFLAAIFFNIPGYGIAATDIYRSVGPGKVIALATGTSPANNLTISGSTAAFTLEIPNNVGVGDVIQYDSDNNTTIVMIADRLIMN